MNKTVTQLLTQYLPTELDGYLAAKQFQRHVDSLEYVRPVAAGTQHVRLVLDEKPRYKAQALAHLLPQLRFVFPALNQRLLDLVGDDSRALIGRAGVTFFVQLQNAAPREVRSLATRWFVFDDETARGSIGSFREFVQKWSVPFLDKYTSLSALTRGYEERDEFLPHDRRFSLIIVAAFTLLDEPEKARQVLDNYFGRPGSMRRYAKAFEYVRRLA